MKLTKKCLQCGKQFEKPYNESLKNWSNRHKYCSRKCSDKNRKKLIPWNKGVKTGVRTIGCFKKGHRTWNKGKKGLQKAWNKGIPFSKASRKKMSVAKRGIKQSEETIKKRVKKFTGNKHYNWKGDKVGYFALHSWIRRHKGKPQQCVDCGARREQRRLHWSSVDHKYRRNIDDYIARCNKCHKIYDFKKGFIKSLGQ